MAWTLLKRGGDYEEYSAMHMEFLVDDESDINTPDDLADNAAPGSLAMTASESKKWRKDAEGNWVQVSGGGGGGGISTMSVTLTVDGWNESKQAVEATGLSDTGVLLTGPSPDSLSEYATCGVMCVACTDNVLTFTCDTKPENDLTVYVGMAG